MNNQPPPLDQRAQPNQNVADPLNQASYTQNSVLVPNQNVAAPPDQAPANQHVATPPNQAPANQNVMAPDNQAPCHRDRFLVTYTSLRQHPPENKAAW